jgi:ribulose-5-phosphate 4-epimerase/fuculose-1-phosphate aldolase
VSAFLGSGAPIFEIRDTDKSTDMLIRDNRLGDALAKSLGNSAVVLMRGHGYVAVGYSIQAAVYRAIYTQINARVQAEAMKLGPVNFLSAEEIPKAQAGSEAVLGRSWELWKSRVGKIE